MIVAVILTIAVVGWMFVNREEPQSLTDEQQIRKIYQEQFAWTRGKQRGAIGTIHIQANWATGVKYAVYIDTGKSVPSGPGIMVFRKIFGRWYAVKPGSWLEDLAIDWLPTSLLPEDAKPYFK